MCLKSTLTHNIHEHIKMACTVNRKHYTHTTQYTQHTYTCKHIHKHTCTQHTLTQHTPSHNTHPHSTHILTQHTPSLNTYPHTTHTLIQHTPSLNTHPHTIHTLTQHTLTQHTPSHNTPSLNTHPHITHPLTHQHSWRRFFSSSGHWVGIGRRSLPLPTPYMMAAAPMFYRGGGGDIT